MINLKLIDQPTSAPVVVCYKFDSLIKLRIFFNGLLEMRLGLLTFYFRRPKGSKKIFLCSSLDNGTICISTSWSIITMFVIFPSSLSKLCVTYTVEIWKTKMLTSSPTASRFWSLSNSITSTGCVALKTRKCLFHMCTTAQNSNPRMSMKQFLRSKNTIWKMKWIHGHFHNNTILH